MRSKSWDDDQLKKAVAELYSLRSVIKSLGLVPAGGNYVQVSAAIARLNIDTSHFTGSRWNKDKKYILEHIRRPLGELLTKDSAVQSFKLKTRLFAEGILLPFCMICGWSEKSTDGRIPVELDHINGDRFDNRLENLRILCPNCHSLQPTHRGLNKKSLRGRVL